MRAPVSDSYTHALADIRSCLAAMADLASFDASIGYESLLLDLDSMHGGVFPPTFPVTGSLAHLHRRTEARLHDLAYLGTDSLSVELILVDLGKIARSHSRAPPHRSPHSLPYVGRRSAHSRSTP